MKKFIFAILALILISSTQGETLDVRESITPPNLKMMLPKVIYAVPGIESNIYFENIIDLRRYLG